MQPVETNAPLAIGQIVQQPELKTKHVVLMLNEDKTKAKITTFDWHDIEELLLWDRYEPDTKFLVSSIANWQQAQKETKADYDKYYRENIELRAEIKKLKRQAEADELRLKKQNDMVERVRVAEGEVARLELSHGNAMMKKDAQIRKLEKELATIRNSNLDAEALKNELSLAETKLHDITQQLEESRTHLIDYRTRWEAMNNTDGRIKSQESAMQFVTLRDDVTLAPTDNLYAQMLSDGWTIQNISYHPIVIDNEGTQSTHTQRYICFTRQNPALPENDLEEVV